MDKLRINSFGRAQAYEVALAQGFYAQDNLEVEHHVTQSSKAQMQELIAGVWDVVHTNADNVFWWSEDHGADLLIVLATAGRPNQDFVVRPEVAGYDDLQGKPIAVDAAESGFATPLRVLLKEHGLEQEGRDFSFLEVGATQQRVAALKEGRAFGAMVGAGQYQELIQEGFHALDSINRLYRTYAGTAAVRRSWAVDREQLLVRYLRAHSRAGQWISRQSASDSGPPPPFCWEGLREMLELRSAVGLLRGTPEPTRFADDTYYRQGAQGL